MTNEERIYKAYGQAQSIKGSVIELGLGWGTIADNLMDRQDITKLVSYERDLSRISDYTIKDNDRHTVVAKDVLNDTITGKFDVGIVDVFENRSSYAEGQQIVNKIKGSIKQGGKIVIEYQQDVPEERDFRAFMESNFGAMKTEFINTGVRLTTRHIGYYEL